MKTNFVHLHIHSHYSLLDGLPKIDTLINKAVEQQMPALALTDHGVMYGVIEFYQKAKAAGIKPIIGIEAYLARNGLHNKNTKEDLRPYHLVLLAKNQTGYENLIKITTKAHIDGFYYKPRIDFEYLQNHAKGLIALSACLAGEVSRSILNKGFAGGKKTAQKYKDLFKDDFYLEVQHNPNIPEQKIVNQEIFKIAKELKIKVVVTNDVHYVEKTDAEAQDALLCIQMKKTLDDKSRITMMGDDWSFLPAEELRLAFPNNPEVLQNTLEIVEKCNLEIKLNEIQLPYYELPVGKTDTEVLEEKCVQNLKKRYDIEIKNLADTAHLNNKDKGLIDRLKYELKIIKQSGYASYFLIVQDFVNWAKKNGVVVGPGRGSAAGSMVTYLLRITNVDPIKYDLLFERFLNPDRISMPDIDIDFADTRRDDVIHYIEKKYGKKHVAQIITFGTMAARAAIRDVGRVMDLPYNFCDKVAKSVPMFTSLQQALDSVTEFKALYNSDPQAKKMIELAKKIEGAARHTSVHACGLVITKEPLSKYMPVQYASADDHTIVAQYSLHPIEDLGLLKIDLLGLKNLTIIEHALYIIEKTVGDKIDIDEIDLEDIQAMNLLKNGQTIGVFQLESSGMRRYLKELKPSSLEDIIAMVALYRPGPLNSGMVDEFISRKHGRTQITYKHELMKNALKNTYGVIVYQEQVMQLSKDMAGFSGGQADTLRKAMGKKIADLMAKMKEDFIKGCLQNKLSKELAEGTFADMEKFAEYGFNRSHAACYAMIAYQTAFLKANYPAQFMASLMTSDYGNQDRISVEVEEAKRLGIEILPPDINESFSKFTVVAESLANNKPRIRFGLEAIKNVGSEICREIIDERKENGKFTNLEDFLRRVQTKHLNKKSMESMIKCGAMDSLGFDRALLLHNLELLLKFSKNIFKETESGQNSLFGISPTVNISKLQLSPTDPADPRQKLSWEKELLGLYISDHPLTEYREQLKNITPFSSLDPSVHTQIKAACIVSRIKKIYTKKNQPMIFAGIEDLSKEIEAIVFPKLYEQTQNLWEEDKLLVISGKLSDKDNEIKILVDTVEPLNEESLKKITTNNSASQEHGKNIVIQLPSNFTKNKLDSLKSLLEANSGMNKVFLKIKDRLISTTTQITLTRSIIEDIEKITGEKSISIRHNV